MLKGFFAGKYTYAHPEHKKTVEAEIKIQEVINKVLEKHGNVIGDTSSMRHFTLAFGCTGDHEAIASAVKSLVPDLLKKHGKESFTIRVQQFMFCPGPAPFVAITPLPGSPDWNFFAELQGALLLDPKVNAAHPDYIGEGKITDEKAFPAGFVDMKKAIDNGQSFEAAAHQWMWPHMSAFRLDDKDSIGTFGSLNREALEAKYGWIQREPIDVDISIRVIGASLKGKDGLKFRMEIEL